MKRINIILVFVFLSQCVFAQTKQPLKKTTPAVTAPVIDAKLEQDKASIKSMCGIYKVTFDFAETFSPDTGYKYHDRYHSWAIEHVFLVEENDKKIALQHLLIINDSTIIKHWRQDWVYENTILYNYYKDDEWIQKTLTPAQAKGTWTQKVYQVDDSPRYESYGTWIHVDGKHYWEGSTDSPLPRREYTKRSDYNLMRRHSRMEILGDGWVLIQDNEKIIRNGGMDKLLCWEKGVEKFTKGDYDSIPAVKYWEKQKNYWADVRAIWNEVFSKSANLKFVLKVDDKKLYQKLFELGNKHCNDKVYTQGNANEEIKKTIELFMRQT